MRADAGIGPYGYHAVPCRAGCPHPAARQTSTLRVTRRVGVPDDPCPLPASKNRPGNDTHPTNSISVYSVLPLKKASAGMVT